jgi:hypothetical protein
MVFFIYSILCFATLFDFKTTSQKNKYSFATVGICYAIYTISE